MSVRHYVMYTPQGYTATCGKMKVGDTRGFFFAVGHVTCRECLKRVVLTYPGVCRATRVR